jgi:hypothetical protein
MHVIMLLQTMQWYKRQMIMMSMTRNIVNVNSFNLKGLPKLVGCLFWARFVWNFFSVNPFNFQGLLKQMGGFFKQEMWKVLPMWTFSISTVSQAKTNGRFFLTRLIKSLGDVSPFNFKYSWFSLELVPLVS